MNVCRFNGNGSGLVANLDVSVTVAETRNLTLSGSGTFNFGAVIFWDSLIISRVTGGAKAARNSQLFDVDTIAESYGSKIWGGLTQIGGDLTDCRITTAETVNVFSSYRFSGCAFIKSDAQKKPLFSFGSGTQRAEFSGCRFEVDGLLCYSENTNLTIDLISCTAPDNFAKALSNGYAKVNLTGCGVRGNSTATTVDGVGCRLFAEDPGARKKGIFIDSDPIAITSDLTYWHGAGIGSATIAGDSLVVGESLSLDSTPWGANTIRYAPVLPSGEGWPAVPARAWRYGGQATVKIEYPIGTHADPLARICVAAVCPRIPVGELTSIIDHHFYGKSTGANIPNRLGAKEKNFLNFWCGQVNIQAPAFNESWNCTDEWGDVVISRAAGANIWGLFRIVIYDEGGGVIPTGTKITIDLGVYAPTTDQYKAYWPDTPFATVRGMGGQSTGGGGGMSIGDAEVIWKTPYVFRSADANGIEIAKARPDFGTGFPTPTPIDLPVTVWTNGTTLNGSYS